MAQLSLDEMAFYLTVAALISTTVIALAKIFFLHVNPNGNSAGTNKT